MATKKDETKEAETAKTEDLPKIDETVPGGKYIVGDRFVDAEGKDLGPAGKAAKEE